MKGENKEKSLWNKRFSLAKPIALILLIIGCAGIIGFIFIVFLPLLIDNLGYKSIGGEGLLGVIISIPWLVASYIIFRIGIVLWKHNWGDKKDL